MPYKPITLNQSKEFKETAKNGAHVESERIGDKIDALLAEASSLAVKASKE